MASTVTGVLIFGLCVFKLVYCSPLKSDASEPCNQLCAIKSSKGMEGACQCKEGAVDSVQRSKKKISIEELRMLPIGVISRPRRCAGALGSEHVAKSAVNLENVGSQLTDMVSKISQRVSAVLGDGAVGKAALPVTPDLTKAKEAEAAPEGEAAKTEEEATVAESAKGAAKVTKLKESAEKVGSPFVITPEEAGRIESVNSAGGNLLGDIRETTI